MLNRHTCTCIHFHVEIVCVWSQTCISACRNLGATHFWYKYLHMHRACSTYIAKELWVLKYPKLHQVGIISFVYPQRVPVEIIHFIIKFYKLWCYNLVSRVKDCSKYRSSKLKCSPDFSCIKHLLRCICSSYSLLCCYFAWNLASNITFMWCLTPYSMIMAHIYTVIMWSFYKISWLKRVPKINQSISLVIWMKIN